MSGMMTQEEAMNMSNEQAIQILIPMRNMMYDQNGCPISDAVFALDKAIEALSTDEPQGEWIYTMNPLRLNDEWECSKCGHLSFAKVNYCGHCGCRMKGADNE